MKMMKGIATIMLTAMAMNMAAQNFTLKGHFTDVRNDTLLVSYTKREPDKQQIETKVPINADGRFSYSCDIQNAYNAQLVVQSNGNKAFLFFVPGESVEIAGPSTSDNDWTIDGSAFYRNGVRREGYSCLSTRNSMRQKPSMIKAWLRGWTKRSWKRKETQPMSIPIKECGRWHDYIS